jgi:hypothetical protein
MRSEEETVQSPLVRSDVLFEQLIVTRHALSSTMRLVAARRDAGGAAKDVKQTASEAYRKHQGTGTDLGRSMADFDRYGGRRPRDGNGRKCRACCAVRRLIALLGFRCTGEEMCLRARVQGRGQPRVGGVGA